MEGFSQFRIRKIDPELYRLFRSRVALDPAKPTINDVFLAFVEEYSRQDAPAMASAATKRNRMSKTTGRQYSW